MHKINRFHEFVNESDQPKPGINDAAHAALRAVNSLKLAHWSTDKFAQHEAFGKIHDEILALVDDFVESASGRYGEKTEAGDAVGDLGAAVATMRLVAEGNPELSNIVDEIGAKLDKLKYLLTLK